MKTKTVTALIYLCAAATMIGLALARSFYPGWVLARLVLLLEALLFTVAAITLRYKPLVGHWVALLTGAVALVCLHWQPEFRNPLSNAWITLNLPDSSRTNSYILDAKLTILSIWFTLTVIGTATLRLLPLDWTIRKSPIRNRTWPALAVSFVVLAMWFSRDAIPYRIPIIADIADRTAIRILHIEKRGLQFHEALVQVRVDSVFEITRDDRRLFEYRFRETLTSGHVPQQLEARTVALAASDQLRQMRTAPAKQLRAWNAEAWYFAAPGIPFQSFSTEMGTKPPAEIVELFHQVEALSTDGYVGTQQRKDVCLGFCYDPAAAFGSLYENQRCRWLGNSYQCL